MTAPVPRGELTLTKLHGLGNDFLVVLEPPGRADGSGRPDAALVRRLCDRHRGIGADGLIVGTRAPGGDRLIFGLSNADGSEAEVSGNGLRCLAHAALDAGWLVEGDPTEVLTPAGHRRVTIRRQGPYTTWAAVEMGHAKVRGETERCNVGHGHLLVDTGNPHLVVLGPDPATVDVATLGPLLQATDPAGLNVEFVALGPGPDEVTMRVWERGVGETEACGSGACAAAVALRHWGRVGSVVTVHQPGGPATVDVGDDLSITLAGPSQHIAVCTVPL